MDPGKVLCCMFLLSILEGNSAQVLQMVVKCNHTTNQ